jgi:hypothetical protein
MPNWLFYSSFLTNFCLQPHHQCWWTSNCKCTSRNGMVNSFWLNFLREHPGFENVQTKYNESVVLSLSCMKFKSKEISGNTKPSSLPAWVVKEVLATELHICFNKVLVRAAFAQWKILLSKLQPTPVDYMVSKWAASSMLSFACEFPTAETHEALSERERDNNCPRSLPLHLRSFRFPSCL